MLEIRYYVAGDGQEPFADWFADLEPVALVILLTGGTKRRQQRDIDAAHAYWQDYKTSKRGRR